MSDSLTVFGTDYTGVTGIKAKGTGNGMLTYIRPTGTKSISANGTGIDVAAYALVDVSVSGGGGGDSYTRTIVVPQQTVTPDSNRQFEFTYSSSFVDGEYYVVTLDGVEWLTTSETIWENEVVIGDASVPWNTSDTVYPFVMSSGVGYSTNTNQHTLKVEHLEFVDGPLTLISKSITANGTYNASSDNADGYSSVTVDVPTGGSSMNVQVAQSTTRVASTTYTETASLTCAVSGTYDVYWDCFRSSTSGTNGSQLYIGGSAYGSANTTFSNHAQNNHLTGVQISAGQDVAVYVRSRATNYYAYCGQLTIIQTA